MSRSNVEDIRARRVRHNSASYGTVRYDLTGSYVIAPDGPTFHFLDGGAVARTVYLPSLMEAGGQQYFIVNRNSSAGLNIVDADGVAVATIGFNGVGLFLSSASEWRYMLFPTTGPVLGTSITIASSPYTVVAADTMLYVDTSGGAVTILLQPSAARIGVPLSIKDVTGNALTNNVTITPNGAEVIDGLTSYPLNFAYAGVRLNPRTSSYTVAP